MGKYINQNSKGETLGLEKAKELIADGATPITEPKEWQEGLVCVVNNGFFEAAGYCYSPDELEAFKYPDGRSRTWLHYPKAKELAK